MRYSVTVSGHSRADGDGVCCGGLVQCMYCVLPSALGQQLTKEPACMQLLLSHAGEFGKARGSVGACPRLADYAPVRNPGLGWAAVCTACWGRHVAAHCDVPCTKKTCGLR